MEEWLTKLHIIYYGHVHTCSYILILYMTTVSTINKMLWDYTYYKYNDNGIMVWDYTYYRVYYSIDGMCLVYVGVQ